MKPTSRYFRLMVGKKGGILPLNPLLDPPLDATYCAARLIHLTGQPVVRKPPHNSFCSQGVGLGGLGGSRCPIRRLPLVCLSCLRGPARIAPKSPNDKIEAEVAVPRMDGSKSASP